MKFIYFLFLSLMLLVLCLRNHCPIQGHKDLVSKSFIVLALTLKKTFDPFEISFWYAVGGPTSSISPAPLKRVFFPPLIVLVPLLKIHCSYMIYFTFSILSHGSLCISLYYYPFVYVSLDYSSFVISFEVKKWASSNFVLLYQYCFGYSGPLEFRHKSVDQFVNFCKIAI